MRTEIFFSSNLDTNCPPFHILFNYQSKGLQPTNITIFDQLLPSNVDVNKFSSFIAYYVGHHVYLLASEDFYHLSTFLQKIKKSWIQELSGEEALVVKILYNEKVGNRNRQHN